MIGALRKVYDANLPPPPHPKKSVIYKWITSFKEGWSLVEGDKQFDRPLTSVCDEKKCCLRFNWEWPMINIWVLAVI